VLSHPPDNPHRHRQIQKNPFRKSTLPLSAWLGKKELHLDA
jgi:hypothetical protein